MSKFVQVSNIKDPAVQARMSALVASRAAPPPAPRMRQWCDHPLDAIKALDKAGDVVICTMCTSPDAL
jgi:hypothetical protein